MKKAMTPKTASGRRTKSRMQTGATAFDSKEVLRITWKRYQTGANKLAQRIRECTYPRYKQEDIVLLAVERGGLPLACMLSHRLNVHKLHSIGANSSTVMEALVPTLHRKLLIVVDDVLDTGCTAKAIQRQLLQLQVKKQQVWWAFWALSLSAKWLPSQRKIFFYHTLIRNQWIQFPYESRTSTQR